MKNVLNKVMLIVSMLIISAMTYSKDIKGTLLVGAGKSIVDIPNSFLPQEGFSQIHDITETRALLLDNGVNRIAIIGVEMTSLQADVVKMGKDLISKTANVDPENVFLYCTHSFSSIHVMPDSKLKTDAEVKKNEQLKTIVQNSIINAINTAKSTMKPAKVGYGVGTSNVNINRDLLTADGWWHGYDEHGVSDKSVPIIKFEDLNGNPIAILMNYAVQSSIMNESIMADGAKAITSDLAGAASDYVEAQYDNKVIALFSCGTAGDQEPYMVSNHYGVDKNGKSTREDLKEKGFALVSLLGERLGYEVYQTSKKIETSDKQVILKMVTDSVQCQNQVIPSNIADIKPTKNYDYKLTGTTENVPISIVQIGDIAFVGVQVELSAKTGLYIKKKSPFKNTAIATLVNGAAKYMVDSEAYDKITYESMNSKFVKGSAEMVADKIVSMLKILK